MRNEKRVFVGQVWKQAQSRIPDVIIYQLQSVVGVILAYSFVRILLTKNNK